MLIWQMRFPVVCTAGWGCLNAFLDIKDASAPFFLPHKKPPSVHSSLSTQALDFLLDGAAERKITHQLSNKDAERSNVTKGKQEKTRNAPRDAMPAFMVAGQEVIDKISLS